MAAKRWQILVGLIIIIGMLVTGAFALGIYVGERGWLERGIVEGIQMPGLPLGQQPGAPPAAQPGPQGWPGGQPGQTPGQFPGPQGGQPQREPDLIGLLQQIAPDLLIIETQQGPRQVTITDETKLQTRDNEHIDWKDLQPGDALAIFGEFSEDGARELEALLILKLPPRQ